MNTLETSVMTPPDSVRVKKSSLILGYASNYLTRLYSEVTMLVTRAAQQYALFVKCYP